MFKYNTAQYNGLLTNSILFVIILLLFHVTGCETTYLGKGSSLSRNEMSYHHKATVAVLIFSPDDKVITDELKRTELVNAIQETGLFQQVVPVNKANYLLKINVLEEYYDSDWWTSYATYVLEWELKRAGTRESIWKESIKTASEVGLFREPSYDYLLAWQKNVKKGLSALSRLELNIPTHVTGEVILTSEINWELENIAVADLKAYTLSPDEVKTLTDKLRSTLVKTRYFRVLSRAEMQEILKEQNFQKSDRVDDSAILVEMGKILAVQKIVGGTIGKVGNTFHISLRMINVETGEIEQISERQLEGKADDLIYLIDETGKELAFLYSQEKLK